MSAAVEFIRRLARVAISRGARDVTSAMQTRSALVLAPHPDDETLGCGATILRKVASGARVTVAVVTDGRHSHRSAAFPPERLAELRREEMRDAATRLGLDEADVRWLDFEDGNVAEHEDRLVEAICALLDELRPAELYATSAMEPHSDHAAVGRAARRAATSSALEPMLLEYPVWLWGTWPLRRGDRIGSLADAAVRAVGRRAVVVRAREQVGIKLHALAAHGSQLGRPDGVSAHEEWMVLPAPVLSAAADEVEVFFPIGTSGRAQSARRTIG